MPPLLALLFTLAFCCYLLRRLSRENPNTSGALWLPVIWIFFIGSRFPMQWLDLFGIGFGGGSSTLEDGSPLDALFFLTLIVTGSIVLQRRRINLIILARENVWLTLFFIYCFLAIFWSDFPFVAFKRWFKTLGHPVMALIILTDPNFSRAFQMVMKRCAIIMLPLSVLFIKYFPEYGRGFDWWTGEATNRGINLNKNELGYSCYIFGVILIWNLLTIRRIKDEIVRRQEWIVSIVLLAMVFWLLQISQSATSLATLVLASVIILGLGFNFVSKRFFGTTTVAIIILAVALELSVGIYAPTLELLGRNASLTDRTEVWADALALVDSPILGSGFESFWLGKRLEILWSKWWWQPNQAHNGYIETYLNLGALGLLLFGILMISTFRKISKRLLTDFDFARLRMGFFLTILAYNYTEATFKALHLVWTIFYIIALDVSLLRASIQNSAFPADDSRRIKSESG